MKLIVNSKRIKQSITESEKNQTSIAKDLGVSREHLNNLINGKSNSIKLAMRLSRLLGGKFEDFFAIDLHTNEDERKSC